MEYNSKIILSLHKDYQSVQKTAIIESCERDRTKFFSDKNQKRFLSYGNKFKEEFIPLLKNNITFRERLRQDELLVTKEDGQIFRDLDIYKSMADQIAERIIQTIPRGGYVPKENKDFLPHENEINMGLLAIDRIDYIVVMQRSKKECGIYL